MRKIAETKIDTKLIAQLLDTGTELRIEVVRDGKVTHTVAVKGRSSEAVQQAIKEAVAMNAIPDRRPCPICGKPIATMEEANTNNLVLRPHGGTLRPATWQESLGGGPRQKREDQCDGSGSIVPRIVEVWRAVGFGECPASGPTMRSEYWATQRARWFVENGINGNKAAKVQRFDLPTQKWVTVSVVGDKNATYQVYDVKTKTTSTYGIGGKVSESA